MENPPSFYASPSFFSLSVTMKTLLFFWKVQKGIPPPFLQHPFSILTSCCWPLPLLPIFASTWHQWNEASRIWLPKKKIRHRLLFGTLSRFGLLHGVRSVLGNAFKIPKGSFARQQLFALLTCVFGASSSSELSHKDRKISIETERHA